MALPNQDVLSDLYGLITTVTGFKESHPNFEACRKYCLSHFMHHNYSSINRSTVQSDMLEYQDKFYVKGQFELSKALKEQVDKFLSFKDVFKANPECQIEWVLLSLVSNLSCNLSKFENLPSLLPVDTAPVAEIDFDWGSYLREGLPRYHYDSESESFSSLSSDGEEVNIDPSSVASASVYVTLSDPPEPEPPQTDELLNKEKISKIYFDALKERDTEAWVKDCVSEKGNFLKTWSTLMEENKTDDEVPEAVILSEREIIECVLHSLLTGSSLESLGNASVPFLAKNTTQGWMKVFEQCVDAVRVFQEFFNVADNDSTPMVVRAYISCLRHHFLSYELKILELDQHDLSLLQLEYLIETVSPFILAMRAVHVECTSGWEAEPAWATSVRILTSTFKAMVECHCDEMRGIFLGIFLTCMAVFNDIMDSLITSLTPCDHHQESIVKRIYDDDTICYYITEPYESLNNLDVLPVIMDVAQQVASASVSLSMLHTLNRFGSIKSTQSTNKCLFVALKREFCRTGSKVYDGEDLMSEMTRMLTKETDDIQDFLQVSDWIQNSGSVMPVYKVIEKELNGAIIRQMSQVRALALDILVSENQLSKHLTLLRNLFLHNDASLLLPFCYVFFNEKSCWSNNEYLTILMRDCLTGHYGDLAGNVSVMVVAGAGLEHKNVIEAIDCLTVSYQVDYPLTLVITPENLRKYNGIFRTLLKIKWALTLAQLPFQGKFMQLSTGAQYVAHRLQILRFGCLSDLHIFNNYFITQVTAHLERECSQYQDVQLLIQEHDQLLERIYVRCMLSEGDKNYSLIFNSIIPLCFDIRKCWNLREKGIVAKLKLMERTHKGLHQKLRHLMSYLESETYLPFVAIKFKADLVTTQYGNLTSYSTVNLNTITAKMELT